jgi:hypothetical protein
MSGWIEIRNETDNPEFWICYHACMLFIFEVITYETFMSIYNKYSNI